jgi:hypothetical protein
MVSIGSKRRRLISLPPQDVIQITHYSLYAIDAKIIEDHESWIRARKNQSHFKRDKALIDIEISQQSNSSLMEVHVYPMDSSESHETRKQLVCDEVLKYFYTAFTKIIEPNVKVIDPDVTQPESRVRRAEVKEVIKERVLVICPFCGHKNEQGMQTCAKCKASI